MHIKTHTLFMDSMYKIFWTSYFRAYNFVSLLLQFLFNIIILIIFIIIIIITIVDYFLL